MSRTLPTTRYSRHSLPHAGRLRHRRDLGLVPAAAAVGALVAALWFDSALAADVPVRTLLVEETDRLDVVLTVEAAQAPTFQVFRVPGQPHYVVELPGLALDGALETRGTRVLLLDAMLESSKKGAPPRLLLSFADEVDYDAQANGAKLEVRFTHHGDKGALLAAAEQRKEKARLVRAAAEHAAEVGDRAARLAEERRIAAAEGKQRSEAERLAALEKRRLEDEVKRTAALEAGKRAEEQRAAAAAKKQAEEDAKRTAALEAKKQADQERAAALERKRAEEDLQRTAALEAKKKADEERLAALEKKRWEEEAKRQSALEAKRKADEERLAALEKKRQEEEAKRQAALEAKRKAEEERLAALEKKRLEEEAKRQATLEAERLAKEEKAKAALTARQAEETRARAEAAAKAQQVREAALRAEQEAKRIAELDAARRAEEIKRQADEAKRLQEMAQRQQAEQQAKEHEAERVRQRAEQQRLDAVRQAELAAKHEADLAAKRQADLAAKREAEAATARREAELVAKRQADSATQARTEEQRHRTEQPSKTLVAARLPSAEVSSSRSQGAPAATGFGFGGRSVEIGPPVRYERMQLGDHDEFGGGEDELDEAEGKSVLSKLTVQRTAEGSRVGVRVDGGARYDVKRRGKSQVVLTLFDTRAESLEVRRVLDARTLETSVVRVLPSVEEDQRFRVELLIELREQAPVKIGQGDGMLWLDVGNG